LKAIEIFTQQKVSMAAERIQSKEQHNTDIVVSRKMVEAEFSEENIIALTRSKENGRIAAKELVAVFEMDAKRKYGDTYRAA